MSLKEAPGAVSAEQARQAKRFDAAEAKINWSQTVTEEVARSMGFKHFDKVNGKYIPKKPLIEDH